MAYINAEGTFADRQAHPVPTVLLLDVRLPAMEGFQVLEQIRQRAQWDGMTVLAWSDIIDERTVTRAIQLGVQHFVPNGLTKL